MNFLAPADTGISPRLKHWLLQGGILLSTTLLSLPVAADPLSPFTAKYSAKLDLLIDLPVTLERSLQKNSDGNWLFTSSISSFVAKQTERSRFRITSEQILPIEYRFKRSIIGRERTIEIDFQPESNRILTYAQGDPWSQQWEAGVLDKLNYQLQLREDLISGRTPLSYRIADGGQIKTYRFRQAGTERLNTPAGEFQCVRLQLERSADQPQTLIWMAPELDYLTVRLLRIDNQGREHILNLKEYRNDNDQQY